MQNHLDKRPDARLSAVILAIALACAACGSDAAAGGNDTVDFDALDVDFDTLDVDVSGIDIAGYVDVQKQDTIGNDGDAADVKPDIALDTTPPECTKDSDCDDKNPCTADSCVSGKCVYANTTAACDDGSACTTGDGCKDGKCVGGSAPNCDDANPCTDDSCDAAKGCVNAPNAVTCSDGNVCTTGDYCSGGKCLADAVTTCTDNDPCTDNACDPQLGCVFTANTSPCDDGDACTLADHCSEDVCSGTPDTCDDGNVCTVDLCAAGGCIHSIPDLFVTCDDGNVCTSEDHCTGASCQGYPVVCAGSENPCVEAVCDLSVGCTAISSSAPCDDGDPCTQSDTCKNFACLGGDVTNCTDGNPCTADTCVTGVGCDNSGATNCSDGNSCTTDSCDLALGCTHETLPGESPCDDGNACTQYDVCSGDGTCSISVPVTCNDNSDCTADSCAPATGCVYLPIAGTCEDGDFCTTGDFCDGGYCYGGFPTSCDDNNPCTDDGCLNNGAGKTTVAGYCTHYANTAACDDGNPCTGGDACGDGGCFGGTTNGCDDNNACTIDFCGTVAPGCGHSINTDISVCDDGNACTSGDACNTVTGACVGATVVTCSDGDPCTSDACDTAGGCLFKPLCDDGDPCTADACTAGSCSHKALGVFHETFSAGNVNGWTLGAEWQIGTAAQGPVGGVPPGDPPHGANPADDGIAGVVIGGNAKVALHDYYWLTSPVIDTTALTQPMLQFWRWLDSDTLPYMTNAVQAWDGAAWQTLWQSDDTSNGPDDTAWQRVAYPLTAVSNAKLQFRIGFRIDDSTVYSVGSWNIDEVEVGELGACVPPLVANAPKAQPLVAKPHRK